MNPNPNPNRWVGRKIYRKVINESVKLVRGGLDFEKSLKMVVT